VGGEVLAEVAEDDALVELGARAVDGTAPEFQALRLLETGERLLVAVLLLVVVGVGVEGEGAEGVALRVGGRDDGAVGVDLPQELGRPAEVACVGRRLPLVISWMHFSFLSSWIWMRLSSNGPLRYFAVSFLRRLFRRLRMHPTIIFTRIQETNKVNAKAQASARPGRRAEAVVAVWVIG
jgi:hypothetical protein